MKKLISSIACLGAIGTLSCNSKNGSSDTPELSSRSTNIVQQLGAIKLIFSNEIIKKLNFSVKNDVELVSSDVFMLKVSVLDNQNNIISGEFPADILASYKNCSANVAEQQFNKDFGNHRNIVRKSAKVTEFVGVIYSFSEVISNPGINIYNFQSLAFDTLNDKCYLSTFVVNNVSSFNTDDIERNKSVSKIINSIQESFKKLAASEF